LQFHNEDGLVPQKFVIRWALSILKVEIALAENENA